MRLRGWMTTMLMTTMRRIFNGILNLIYPNLCEICGRKLAPGEEVMCLHCSYELSRTNAHRSSFNVVHERLVGTTPVELGASWFFYYRSSPYVAMIHRGKYNGHPELLRILARKYARELQRDGFFDGIDLIVGVPLHPLKLMMRGYNQTDYIVKGLNDITGIKTGKNLKAARYRKTQTRKGVFSRWLNSQGDYKAKNPADLEGKHILVVDDVLTTGSTLLTCCNAIHEAAPTARISVLTLAVTKLG